MIFAFLAFGLVFVFTGPGYIAVLCALAALGFFLAERVEQS